jgi:hypothetical protein
MTTFQITLDIETRKFFEQPPESAPPFIEVTLFFEQPPDSAPPFIEVTLF